MWYWEVPYRNATVEILAVASLGFKLQLELRWEREEPFCKSFSAIGNDMSLIGT